MDQSGCARADRRCVILSQGPVVKVGVIGILGLPPVLQLCWVTCHVHRVRRQISDLRCMRCMRRSRTVPVSKSSACCKACSSLRVGSPIEIG